MEDQNLFLRCLSFAFKELTKVVSCALDRLKLNWLDTDQQGEQSKLDECFLLGCNLHPHSRFIIMSHQDLQSSCSDRITNLATSDFTTIIGLVKQGYMNISKVISFLRKFITVIGPIFENKTYLSIESL